MKHGPNPRRGRNRGTGKRNPSSRNQSFESNGPDGKIRGTAQQVLDRYLVLGRDASTAGDPVTAESFYQHAEHYHRLVSAADAHNANNANRGNERARVVPVVSEQTVETGAVKPAASETSVNETSVSEAPAGEAESAA